MNDGIQNSNVATVAITVADPTPPVAYNQSITISPNQSTNIVLRDQATPINGSQLTTTIVTPPADGTLVYNSTTGVYTYTPNQNFTGTDSFAWKVNDGILDSNIATVSISVADPAPVAFNAALVAVAGQTSSLDLADDALAANDNPLSVTIVQPPSDGTLVEDSVTGQYDYTPNASYAGSDSFTFMVNDGFQDSNVATVSILVLPPVPVASNATVNVTANQTTGINLLNDVSAGGSSNPLTLTIMQAPANGTLAYDSQTGLYDYTPNQGFTGTDTFTFQAWNGVQTSNVSTISINVLPPSPVANDISVTATSGETTAINLESEVAAPIGSPVTVTIVQQPTEGSLTYDAQTGLFDYTPNQGYVGQDAFTYQADDGIQESNVATVSLDVEEAESAAAESATITWKGTVNNDWFNPGNWDLGRIPTAQDDVVINAPNTIIDTSSASGDITVNSLSLQAGTLTIASGVTLTIESQDGTTPSDLLVSGSLYVNGTLNINCTVTLNGSQISVGNQGSVFWLGGTITSQNSTVYNYGTFSNAGGTTWNALDAVSAFANYGLFVQDNANTTALNLSFNVINVNGQTVTFNGTDYNTGFVLVQQGTLQLADQSPQPFMPGAQSNGGTFLVEQDATLDFHGGNYDLDAASSVQGAGTVLFSGCCWVSAGSYLVGTTDITAGFVIFGPNPTPGYLTPVATNNCSLTGGNLSGWGQLTVADDFDWSGGTVVSWDPLAAGNGTNMQFTIVLLGTLNMNGPPLGFVLDGKVGYNCTLVNYGTINWFSGSFDFVGLATVNNWGTFMAQGSGSLFGGMLGSFNNYNLFEYSPSGNTTASLGTGFLNVLGTLKVDMGTLYLPAGGSVDGVTEVAAGATLALNTFSFDADSSIAAADGTMTFQGPGGQVTIDCPYDVATTNLLGPTVSFNAGGTSSDVTLSAGTLAGNGDFTVTCAMNWTGGAMAGSGTTVVQDGAQLTINSATVVGLGLDRTLNNSGQITWSGLGGGILSGTGTINNNGTFTKTDNSIVLLNVAFNNAGTLQVQAGLVQLGGGGEAMGSTFTIAQGAALAFANGIYDLYTEINTTGTVIFSGATVTDYSSLSAGTLGILSSSVSFQASVETTNGTFVGGTLSNSETFTINGDFEWNAGVMQGGTINVTACATLTLDGLGLGMADGVVLNNDGIITTEGSSRLLLLSGTATLNNAGAFSVAGEEMDVAVVFNNSGTVAVQSGDLRLARGGQSTGGTFRLSDSTSLTFASVPGTSYTLDSATRLVQDSSTAQGTVFFGGNTTVNCTVNLYQIVVDGGQVNLNGRTSVSQLLLESGTLTGVGNIIVLGTFDWTGGTITSSPSSSTTDTSESKVTITISGQASWFIFDSGTKQGSNRTINIMAGANAYLFDGATLTLTGSVTIDNSGTFTAYNETSITGTGTNVFNNQGTFNCGNADGTGSCVLNLVFNNRGTGEVYIQGGSLTLYSGSSWGAWNIRNNTALMLVGGGSGTSAQVYTFNNGSAVNYLPALASAQPVAASQVGVVIVAGSGDGGLCVQTKLSVQQLYLVSGTISGYGDLTVTWKMVWSGGTMTSTFNPDRPQDWPKEYGSLTIATGAALFLVGMVGPTGQALTPVLARPLNIYGWVGWVNNNGNVNTANSSLSNSAAILSQGQVSGIPDPATWVGLPGGFGNALYLANLLNNVLKQGPIGNVLSLGPNGWQWGGFGPLSFNTLPVFLEKLPAIERASLDAAFTCLFGKSLSSAILNNSGYSSNKELQDKTKNTLLTGQPADGLDQQFQVATPADYLQLAAGLAVGITQGYLSQYAGLATLAWQLYESPRETTAAIVQGIKVLLAEMANGDFAAAAVKLFPALKTVFQLDQGGKLLSYDGGVAIGQTLGEVFALYQGARALISGVRNFPALMQLIIKEVPRTISGVGQVARAAGPALAQAGAALRNRPGAVAAQVGLALAKGLGTAANAAVEALAARVAAPFKAVQRRLVRSQRKGLVRTYTEKFETPRGWTEPQTPRASRLGRLFQVSGREAIHAEELGEEAARLLGVDPSKFTFRTANLDGAAAAIIVEGAGKFIIEFDPSVLARMDAARQLKVAIAEIQHSRQFAELVERLGETAAIAQWNELGAAYAKVRRGFLDIDQLPPDLKLFLERYFRNEINAELTAYRFLREQGIWSRGMAIDSAGTSNDTFGILSELESKCKEGSWSEYHGIFATTDTCCPRGQCAAVGVRRCP